MEMKYGKRNGIVKGEKGKGKKVYIKVMEERFYEDGVNVLWEDIKGDI